MWLRSLSARASALANPQLPTRGSGRLSDQIIIRVADDFHPGKLAQRQLAADIDPAVYVRCVEFSSRLLRGHL
jgi:hypothetical protein